jgi:hypothetical protein
MEKERRNGARPQRSAVDDPLFLPLRRSAGARARAAGPARPGHPVQGAHAPPHRRSGVIGDN